VDQDGRIKDLVNSTHPTPDELVDTFLPSLFVDGFTERFHQIREEVLAGSGPQEFTFIVDFRGRLEVRRCKMMKSNNDLIVINYSKLVL
jgi:hypothetical protein